MNDVEPEISSDVVQFIERYIPSMRHLQCLLLMWETAPRTWTDSEIAVEIYTGSESAKQVLHHLVEHALIARRSETSESYEFSPWGDVAMVVPRVAREYRLHVVEVTRLIHAKESAAELDRSRLRQSRNG